MTHNFNETELRRRAEACIEGDWYAKHDLAEIDLFDLDEISYVSYASPVRILSLLDRAQRLRDIADFFIPPSSAGR